MIELIGVGKRYATQYEALKDVHLRVERGELVYLTGHSGAGKSTVLKLVAALERPTSGKVVVHQHDVGSLPSRAIPFLRRNLGLILQDHKLLFDRSVLDNTILPLVVTGLGRSEAVLRARAALERVGLGDRESAAPVSLSGGEQQRLCIARAVVNRPSILLADEPTANLDTQYARDILALFRSFNQAGVTVVIATHDEALMQAFPARRIALAHGRIQ